MEAVDTTIAVFSNHTAAEAANKKLNSAGFEMQVQSRPCRVELGAERGCRPYRVTARSGIVTLSGRGSNNMERHPAETAVSRVKDVSLPSDAIKVKVD